MNLDVTQEKLDELGIKLDEDPAGEAAENAAAAAAPEVEPAAAAEAGADIADLAASLEEIKSQLAALRPAERHPAEAEPPPETEPETDEQQAARLAKEIGSHDLGEDAEVAPKLAQALHDMTGKIASELAKLKTAQALTAQKQAAIEAVETNQRFWTTVKAEHPDVETLVDAKTGSPVGELAKWIGMQPKGLQPVYMKLASEGTAAELGALVAQFKQSTLSTDSPAGKPNASSGSDLLEKKAAIEKKIAALTQNKPGSISEAPPASAPVSIVDRIKAGEDPAELISAAAGGDRKKTLELARKLIQGD